MSSFGSLNTALTALRFQQTSMDVASTNVANVATEGYVRRRVVGQTLGVAAQPALWAHNTDVGSGVTSKGVQRMTDALLDARQRREHAAQSYLDLTAEVLARVETGFGEPGENGVAAAVDRFRSSLHDLANNPGSAATRSQVLTAAGTLTDSFKLQASHVGDEINDQKLRLEVSLEEARTLAADLAATNEAIVAGKGTDTSSLQDTRDRLALRLTALTGASAAIQADGQMNVTLTGSSTGDLVVGNQAAELRSAVVDGKLTFELLHSDGAVDGLGALNGGAVGAMVQLIDETLPAHLAGLGEVAKNLADAVNAVHVEGFGLNGETGNPLFTYDPGDPAGTLAVAFANPDLVAASAVDPELPDGQVVPTLDGTAADSLAKAIGNNGPYLQLVNEFGTQVASAQRLAANQTTLTTQIDTARDQQAGVSLDEETVNLLMAQRGYEAAARVMSALDEVLDTLINRMAI